MSKREFALLKRESVKTATELGYPSYVKAAIKIATTETEIYRILTTARERWGQ